MKNDEPSVEEKARPLSPPPTADKPKSKWQHHGRVLWREWIKPLWIIGLVMFSFRSAVADWNDVPTGSMKPTILEGDRIFINKLAYDLKFPFTRYRLAQWSNPNWGDVIVLLSPEDSKRLVKRVVGLPGDIIEVRPAELDGTVIGLLYRNGERAEYADLDPWIVDQIRAENQPAFHFFSEQVDGRNHPIMMSIGGGPHFLSPYRVPEGHFFVMGDNRNNSRDSRVFGAVPRTAILGRATAVALSLDREHYYKPRWERFFSDLP